MNGLWIDLNENKCKRKQYNVLKHLIDEKKVYVFYSEKLLPLNLVMRDNETFLKDRFIAVTDNNES